MPPYPSSRHSLCFAFAKFPQKVYFTRGRSSSAHALHLLAGKVKDESRTHTLAGDTRFLTNCTCPNYATCHRRRHRRNARFVLLLRKCRKRLNLREVAPLPLTRFTCSREGQGRRSSNFAATAYFLYNARQHNPRGLCAASLPFSVW